MIFIQHHTEFGAADYPHDKSHIGFAMIWYSMFLVVSGVLVFVRHCQMIGIAILNWNLVENRSIQAYSIRSFGYGPIWSRLDGTSFSYTGWFHCCCFPDPNREYIITANKRTDPVISRIFFQDSAFWKKLGCRLIFIALSPLIHTWHYFNYKRPIGLIAHLKKPYQ